MYDLNDVASQEIARELLLEISPDSTDTDFDFYWSACGGNPWNIQRIYKMLKAIGC